MSDTLASISKFLPFSPYDAGPFERLDENVFKLEVKLADLKTCTILRWSHMKKAEVSIPGVNNSRYFSVALAVTREIEALYINNTSKRLSYFFSPLSYGLHSLDSAN